MLIKTAAAMLLLAALSATALAQTTGAANAPADRASSTPQSPAARRDGALMTHGNEAKPKSGHSETSAGKSGK